MAAYYGSIPSKYYDASDSAMNHYLKLNIKVFEAPNKEWITFVTKARQGDLIHNYDIVVGPKLANPFNLDIEIARPMVTNKNKTKFEFQIAFTSEKGVFMLNKYMIK